MMVDLPDEEIRALLKEYRPLVNRIARTACSSSPAIDLSDLLSVGEFAILRAIKAYDPSHGTTIRSFIGRIVRQEIYNEAARFLGIFTVDHRVTSLAAKVNRLHHKGHTDQEIADLLSRSSNRTFDTDYVRDLRMVYTRKGYDDLQTDNLIDCRHSREEIFEQIWRRALRNSTDVFILKNRIMNDVPVREVAAALNIKERRVYVLEKDLKNRIRLAIEELSE